MIADVTVILPAYNERDNLLRIIPEIHDRLKNTRHVVLVIDDGSVDGTASALAALEDSGLAVICLQQRMGLAHSIRIGIEQAKGEYVVVMDSDGNHQPCYLENMLEAMPQYDCMVASRFLPGGGMRTWWRQVFSLMFDFGVRVLLGSPLKDHLYGYWAARRSLVMRLPLDDIFSGYGDYCLRFLYFLQRETEMIYQFPARNGIRWYGRGNPHLLQTFFQYAYALIEFSVRMRRRENARVIPETQ